MATTQRLNADTCQWVVQALTRLLATYSVALGVLILLGGRARWSGPSYVTALMLPGAPASWGVVLLIVGVLTIWGTFRVKLATVMLGCYSIAVWCFFFGMAGLKTAYDNPLAGTTGIPTYAVLGVTSAILGVVYMQSRRD